MVSACPWCLSTPPRHDRCEGVVYQRNRVKVIATKPAGVRWCFQCRQRVGFVDVCTADVDPSPYDPNWTRRCTPMGHIDGDLGFGMSREWS